jgi:hypothetical protein
MGVKPTCRLNAGTSQFDPLRTSAAPHFTVANLVSDPINVLVLADMMLLPDHEGDP